MGYSNRRKIRDREDAEECVAAWRRSGMSMSEWAAEQGLDGRSLNAWHQAMKRAAQAEEKKGGRLVELVLPTRREKPAISTFVVRAGEFEVEVQAGFDEEALVRLLKVVRSAC